MNREKAVAYALGGLGAVQGGYNYYVKPALSKPLEAVAGYIGRKLTAPYVNFDMAELEDHIVDLLTLFEGRYDGKDTDDNSQKIA